MELPLYLTIQQASDYSGIGQNSIRDMLNSADPPPFIRVGKKRLIERETFPAYLRRKQEVQL